MLPIGNLALPECCFFIRPLGNGQASDCPLWVDLSRSPGVEGLDGLDRTANGPIGWKPVLADLTPRTAREAETGRSGCCEFQWTSCARRLGFYFQKQPPRY